MSEVKKSSHLCHQKDKKHRYFDLKKAFRHVGDSETRSSACVLQAAALLYTEVNNDKGDNNPGGGKRNASEV
jgi:hypothetical protein